MIELHDEIQEVHLIIGAFELLLLRRDQVEVVARTQVESIAS